MLDIAVAYNRYKYVGYEFLTWLWFVTEKNADIIGKLETDPITLEIGNRIVLENRSNDRIETITIKGDDAGLEEGFLALEKGGVVTEMNLVYQSGDHKWTFTIKGESLNISNLKLPETGPIETQEDIEGAVLEKVYFYEKAFDIIDKLYKLFIKVRVSEKWNKDVVPRIKKWIKAA